MLVINIILLYILNVSTFNIKQVCQAGATSKIQPKIMLVATKTEGTETSTM